jgi:hypothetical protein
MRHRLACLCLVFASFTFASAQQNSAVAQVVVPRLIRFTGQLKTSATTVGITFSLHKSQQDNAALWIETQNVQLDSTGKYTVLLGSTSPYGIPTDLFTSGEAQWLSIQPQGQPEQPRVVLVSVPYALRAVEADTLAGHSATDFVTTDKLTSAVQQQLQQQVTAPTAVALTRKGAVSAATPASAGATNYSASTTNEVVLVTQTGTGAGLVSTAGNNYALSGSSTNTAIYASTTGSTHATAAAIEGVSSSASGRGIFGYASSATGANFGIAGQSNSTSGIGIFANDTATTGTAIGLEAQVNSASGTAAIFQNRAGGNLFTGESGSTNTKVFGVDGIGNVTTTGSIGIGALTAPANPLTVSTSTANYGIYVNNTNSSGYGLYASGPYGGGQFYSTSVGVYGNASATGGYGVQGVANGFAGYAIYGTASGNGGYGIYGDANGTNGFGVSGFATSGVGVYGGNYGSANPSAEFQNLIGAGTKGVAVVGTSGSATPTQINNQASPFYDAAGEFSGADGIIAQTSTDANNGFAVIGINTGTAGVAIYGDDLDKGANSYAGFFIGPVYVSGALTGAASIGSSMDDPIDPANKILNHASVESPEMKNIYDGTVILNERGEAEVALPKYFEALNKDFRYQLTCIGGYAPVYVARKVHNNAFAIAGGTPGLEVSWQVTGVRNDAYATAHPIVTEEDKAAGDRGHYLHPVELGASPDKAIETHQRGTSR